MKRHVWRGFWQLYTTNLRELMRDSLLFSVVVPFVVIGGLGLVFNRPAEEPVRVALVDGPGAEALAGRLEGLKDVVLVRTSGAEAQRRLERGLVALVVAPGSPPELVVDRSNPEHRLARLLVNGALQRPAGGEGPAVSTERVSEIPGRRYVDFLVPGFLAFMLMNTASGVANQLVEDRQKKLLKRYAATPMRRWQYLVSHALSRLTLGLWIMPIFLLAGFLTFGVTVRGSAALLVGFMLFGALMLASLGYLLGARFERTDQTHTLFTIINLPQFVISGAFFSIERFPEPVVKALRLLPLNAFVDGLRAIMNEAATAGDVAPQALILLLWGLPATALALKLFRWQ